MTMPITVAARERSFSTLKSIKPISDQRWPNNIHWNNIQSIDWTRNSIVTVVIVVIMIISL